MTKRLVWYLHFHKAGGSSLVQLASVNGENLYPINGNGNPRDANGKDVRTWEMSKEGLDWFIDDALKSGVSFVASEWGVPDLEVLAAREDVVTVCIVRDPVSRIISNFKFDFYRPFESSSRSIAEYTDHYIVPWTHSNYYTRMLLGGKWRIDDSDERKLELAQREISLIDVVAPLEASDAYDRIGDVIGWSQTQRHVNISGMSVGNRVRMFFQRIKGGRLDLVRRLLQTPRVSPADRDRLANSNRVDVMLYKFIVESWGGKAAQ